MVTYDTLRTCEGKHVFFKIDLKFETAVDLNKCLKQIKLPISTYSCAPISELPSDKSTMGYTPHEHTECPEIYRKTILHLLKYAADLYLSRCSTDLLQFLGHSV